MDLLSLFRRTNAPAEAPTRGGKRSRSAAAHDQAVQQLRLRARHRLIGAAVLVGLGIIAFPLVFETQPRPVPMDLPIVIPAKESAAPLVTPRVAAASLPEAAQRQPEPTLPPVVEEAPAETPPASVAPPVAEAKKPLAAPEVKKPVAEAKKPEPAASSAGRFVVQVGAFADKGTAQEARRKLESKGLKTYTQVAKTKDGDRIRVRLGPFAERAEADKALAKAKALGLDGAVLTL